MKIPGYRTIRKINQGGMSSVYLAIQLSVGREVALKVMSPTLNGDPVFSERFQREANIVGQLSHPNIISVYDIGRYKNLNYIAMDYLAGGSVQERIARGMSAREALRIARQVATALDHAHEKGYIHRDIKPENILFREDGSAVLSDFGVARAVSSVSRMTNAGTVVGTPHYMSPEQTRGKPVDGRADIYSLGVVLFEMLTGEVPYDAEESVAIAIKHLTAPIPHLPPPNQAYQGLINRALAKDPDKRFQRGSELAEAIDALGEESGLTRNYLDQSSSTRVQLLSLMHALLATAGAALREQLRPLLRWRWNPSRGLYRRTLPSAPGGKPTLESERATEVVNRAEPPAPDAHSGHPRPLAWALGATLATVVLWLSFSLALNQGLIPGQRWLPEGLTRAAQHSAALLVEPAPTPDGQAEKTTPVPEHPLVLRPAPLPDLLRADPVPTEPQNPPPEQPEGPRQPLQVSPQPENARVRILNIAERYYPGIPLLPGRYHIETSHDGYDTDRRWIEIGEEPVALSVRLRKTPVSGASFRNELAPGGRGPEMVIVPAGQFTMGSTLDDRSMPERRVRLPRAFAISRFEITYADYLRFTRATDREPPHDNGWGRGNRPVTNVSWRDARDYAQWLNEVTGKPYRLPSEAEWEYTARAGTDTAFWWGEAGADASGMANCRRGCESDYTGLFSARSAPVGRYPANDFGLHDTAGNVAEWTLDCYRDHLLDIPRNGEPLRAENCEKRTVRGGSFADPVDEIASYRRAGQTPDYWDSTIGFRVVVELY